MEGKNGVEMRVGKQEARGEGSLMRMLLPTTMRCSKENMVRYLLCKMAMVGWKDIGILQGISKLKRRLV